MNIVLHIRQSVRRATRVASLVLICVSLGACVGAKTSSRPSHLPPPETIFQTYQRVSTDPRNTVMALSDSIRVVVEADDATYLFSLPSHPAHPSYLYSRIIRKPDGWYRITSGYSEGDESAFERWLVRHQRHDGTLRSN